MKKSPSKHLTSRQGSALITVVFLSALILLLSGTMLRYSLFERQADERNRLFLRTRVMAENISNYATAQMSDKLPSLGVPVPTGRFAWTSSATTTKIVLPPNAILDNGVYSDPNIGMEVRCSVSTASAYAIDTDPTSRTAGLQVSNAPATIIAKATSDHPALRTNISSHVRQDLDMVFTPLFQFGMFYNMDLELYPSQTFTMAGPVHSNKRILVHPQGSSDINIKFLDRISSADWFVADYTIKVKARVGSGAFDTFDSTKGHILIRDYNVSTSFPDVKNASNLWQDDRWKSTTYPPTATATVNFKKFATDTYNGNLQSKAHGVQPHELPGVDSYDQDTAPNEGRQIIESPDHKRFDPTGTTTATKWPWSSDSDIIKRNTKISWRSGLYIMVNPTDQVREGKLPDGTIAKVVPFAYRCWLNTRSGSARTCDEIVLPGQPSWGFYDPNASVAGDEIAFKNTMPNRYTNTTAVGRNQVLRIPMKSNNGTDPINAWDLIDKVNADGTFLYDAGSEDGDLTTGYPTRIAAATPVYPAFPADGASYTPVDPAYFFDMRRADANGATSSATDATSFGRSATFSYTPRPIAKIDLDMARLKMMVARVNDSAVSFRGYRLKLPTDATTWSEFIYNPAANYGTILSAASPNLNLGYDLDGATSGWSYTTFPSATNATTQNYRDPFNLYYVPGQTGGVANSVSNPMTKLVSSTNLNAAWTDGVSIYLHSLDAERREQASGIPIRTDSGVRLWNGRGSVVSLLGTENTGCTIGTNDAVYTVGHYNADGTINATDTSTVNPGGYSARYADRSTEKLCAIFGDAYTALSQPEFENSSGTIYRQADGWCDALSAFPVAASSAGWRTSGAGSADGFRGGGTQKPGRMPYLNVEYSGAVAATLKLDANPTEISSAFCIGIIPSHHNPTNLTDLAPTTSNGTTVTLSGKEGNGVNSGGANNYPRLLEAWGGRGLYIRGSMVAMFESRVAMEPFSYGRCYTAPGRYWGLHYDLSQADHDIPLEPILVSANRRGFREISAADYQTTKTAIEALSVIP